MWGLISGIFCPLNPPPPLGSLSAFMAPPRARDRLHSSTGVRVVRAVEGAPSLLCRLWNYDTGALLASYEDLVAPPNEITCAAVDKDARKFFVGTLEGKVMSFNYTNGLKVCPGLGMRGFPTGILRMGSQPRLLVCCHTGGLSECHATAIRQSGKAPPGA